MNCWNSSCVNARLAVGARARAGLEAQETASIRVIVGVLLSLVGASPVSLFLPIAGGLRQRLWQVYRPAIWLAE